MNEIIIEKSEIDGGKLTSTVTPPKKLEKYFKSFEMFAIFDTEVSSEKSIINIPLLATVLPLAWLTDTDIHVDVLDKTFKASMEELRNEFNAMYPGAEFNAKISADVLVDNKIGNSDTSDRTGLLFSGGVDSTYSLITNLDLKPRLVMLWGVEGHSYPKYSRYWEKVISVYTEFAGKLGLPLHIIKSNPHDILHERRIEHDFYKRLQYGGLWGRLQHSLVTITLMAPLSMGRFDQILIAASHNPIYDSKYTWVSMPSTDEKISWADLNVKHDGYILRYKKITGKIKGYLKTNSLVLRKCMNYRRVLSHRKKLNCGACGMCFNTIAPLAQAGIDPNKCGFEIGAWAFQRMRRMFEKEKISESLLFHHWHPVQKNIPDKIENDIHGSKEFFEWFRDFDLKSIEKDVWKYRMLYLKLPWFIAKRLDKFIYQPIDRYTKWDLWIHEENPTISTHIKQEKRELE